MIHGTMNVKISQMRVVFSIVELYFTRVVGEQLRTFENKVMGRKVLSIRLEVIEIQGL